MRSIRIRGTLNLNFIVMLKERDYQAIINLYTDKYSNNGSKFPLNLEQTDSIVNLVKKHISIIKNYPKEKQKILSIYAKSVSIRGIKEYLNMPTLQAALIYKVIYNYAVNKNNSMV